MSLRNKHIGKEKYNNYNALMRIVEYKNRNNIDVYIKDYDYIVYNTDMNKWDDGTIKCPYDKIYYNKAYIGEGKYSKKNNPLAFQKWQGILNRTLSNETKQKHQTYEKCTICEEWLNFQNFAEWFEENYYEIEGQRMEIDKDILYKRNKLYSPYTCIIVPHDINMLFIKHENRRGDLPIGVYWDNYKQKFRSEMKIEGKIIKKSFKTPVEAFEWYKINKEKRIKEIADKYKNVIPSKLYIALYKYEVEIID